MTRPDVRALLLTLLLALAPGAWAAQVTLVYSGNLDGELEPCGCTAETDYGGLLRRATYVDGLRDAGLDPVVITTGGLLTAAIGADRIKAEFILSGLTRSGVDGVGVQWADLVYGPSFLAAHALPYVASNWLDDELPRAQAIARPGARLRLFQWLDPAASPLRGMQGGQRLVDTSTAPLAAALAEARARGETTLLATTLDYARARSELPLDDVVVLLVAASPERPGEAHEVEGTLVLSPGTRGMRLGRVDLQLAADGALAGWTASVVELTNAVADAPRLADWYTAYNDALREDYLRQVAARKARRSGQSPFAGAATCTECHRTASTVWHATNHAGALGILEGVGKAFDPNCVVCHSVGFGSEGGFLALDETPELANVQCESCHGPGRAHVADGGATYPGKRNAAEACAGCHHPHHSPSFDYAGYWPRIAHGHD